MLPAARSCSANLGTCSALPTTRANAVLAETKKGGWSAATNSWSLIQMPYSLTAKLLPTIFSAHNRSEASLF